MDDQSPLSGAKMLLSQRGGDFPRVYNFQSARDGSFDQEVAPGKYLLLVSYQGFALDTQVVKLSPGRDLQLTVFMSRRKKVKASKDLQLDQQIITASRRPLQSLDLPFSISTLSREQMMLNNSRSMPEALMGTAGVWVQKTNHGGGSAFVRGLTGNQTLLLIDGIRVNNAGFRYGPNQYLNLFDPFTIDKVEVVRGSGSVQYGSDALGGAINLLTQPLEFSPNGKFSFKVDADLKLGTAFWDGQTYLQERSSRAVIKLMGSRSSTRLGLSVKDFGELVAGGELGPQPPSSYLELGIDFKSQVEVGENSRLTLAFNRLRQDSVGRYDQVTQLGKYDLYQFDPQERTLAYLRWERENKHPLSEKIMATASFQQFVEERDKRRRGAATTNFERDIIGTGGFSLVNVSPGDKKWKHSTGIEVYYDQISSETRTVVDSSGVESLSRGLYPELSSMTQAGVFTLHHLDVNNVQLNGGLRYNFVNVYAFDETFGDLNISPQAVVGNVGIMYKLSQQSRIFLSGNSGFRSPNVNDMASFGSFDFGIEVPNSQLEAERSLSLEMGYKLQHEGIQWNFSAFYTRLINLIARVPSSYLGDTLFNDQRVFEKTNLDQAFIAGVEGDFRIRMGQNSPWYLEGNATYLYGETIEDNPSPLRRIPPLNGRLRLMYQKDAFRLGVEFMAASQQDRLSGGDISDHRIPDGGTPDWQVFNLYAAYQYEWLEISLKAENLLNQAYRYHGSGVDAYGRSLWMTLAIRMQ